MRYIEISKIMSTAIKGLCISILLCNCAVSFGQNSQPAEFGKGLDLIGKDNKAAKKEFLVSAEKAPDFYGSYHFLGMIYMSDKQIDSAVICFQKALDLNHDNVNHTREMTCIRLMDAYLNLNDFGKAYSTAWEAYLKYPENTVIERTFKDVCLWSFYTKFYELNPSYISPDLKDEYVVNSVSEEYLIIRRIRINGKYLNVVNQSLVSKGAENYDVFKCVLSKSKDTVEVNFKLNWNLNKDFGGKPIDFKSVYSNDSNAVYERIGALLADDPKIDVKKEIEKIEKK